MARASSGVAGVLRGRGHLLIALVVGDEMAACLPAAALACTNGERHETEGEEPREITDEGKKVKW